jgi:mannose-6-phosphate isomerase
VDSPLRFHPYLRPMVWGGRRLGGVLGKPLPAEGAYGESWEVTDHPQHRSVVASGPLTGTSLRDLTTERRAELLGPGAGQHAVFPWLIKFLDANNWLSVQVHPDEQAVRELWPGEGSKTEAWFVVDAAPGSRIYAGLLPGVDRDRFRAALEGGTVADCLHSFEPRPGDCVFLPAGTVHTVGGGVLIAEVQQTSDATFRLFDWNRRDSQGKPRTLHIKEGLAAIHWDQGSVTPVRVPAFPAGTSRQRVPLVRCPYFMMEYVQEREPFAVGGDGRLQALVVLRGRGRLDTPIGKEQLRAGQTWLLPATLSGAECRPEGSLGLLLCSLP